MKQIIKRFAGSCVASLWGLCLAAQPALTRVEYYIDTDPGYGNATAVNITSSVNLNNLVVNIDTATVTQGVHVFGIRAKDANGAWSHDNRWLFARPYSSDTTGPGITPDIKQIEYYIDNDPGYGKGVQIGAESIANLANFNLSVNISGLAVGAHILFIRSRDNSSAWSLDNKFDFTVSSAVASPSIVVNSVSKKTMCAGSSFTIGYEAKGTYNNGNIFTVQLSNNAGSFTSPTIIGTLTSKVSGIINCVLPNTLISGTQYKVRVISSAPSVTGIIRSEAIIINALPSTPTITPSGATTFCAGSSVTLTSSSATNNVWSNGATTQNINVTTSGNYTVTVSNASGCTATSLATTVTVNPNPAPVITPSHSPVNLCPGTTDTLDAGSGYATYQWSNTAITQSIVVSAAGVYTVTVTYATGCSGTSAPVNVTYATCPKPAGLKATVTSATTATLKWKAAACAVGFQLQLRVLGSGTWTTIPVGGITYKAKNLLPATTYEWQVATVCQANPQILSAYTVGANFTTPAAAFNDPVAAAAESLKVSEGLNATVSPNPSKNNPVLHIKGAVGTVTITLTDMAGKVLWKYLSVTGTQLSLPTEKLAQGMYLVNVTNGKQNTIVKIVKE